MEAEYPEASRPKLDNVAIMESDSRGNSHAKLLSKMNIEGSGDFGSKSASNAMITTGFSDTIRPQLLATVVMADCEKVLQTLHAKAARNSSEFDDSVASFLSEQTDFLDVRLDISVASGKKHDYLTWVRSRW